MAISSFLFDVDGKLKMNKNAHIFCSHPKQQNQLGSSSYFSSENHPPVNTVGLVKVKTFNFVLVFSYRDGTSQAVWSVLIGPVHQFLLVQQFSTKSPFLWQDTQKRIFGGACEDTKDMGIWWESGDSWMYPYQRSPIEISI